MKNVFLINLLMSFLWAGVAGSFSFTNLVLGFVIASMGLWLIREQLGARRYFTRGRRIVKLLIVFGRELTLSVWRVALLALKPGCSYRPGIIAFPLSLKSDQEITLLANLITLTPGTLSVDLSEDETILYIHCIDVSDPEAVCLEIKNGFERLIGEVFENDC